MTESSPAYLEWLSKSSASLRTVDGKAISVWTLKYLHDAKVLSVWARYFREHYCLDCEIDALRADTGYSRYEYLLNLIFPDAHKAPGPSIRAGDFAEILVSDYVEFLLKYHVPRTRFADKAMRDESPKGVDVIGFRLKRIGERSPDDELITFEVKAQLSGSKPDPRLQDAINDSAKDTLRKAYSLNAIKRHLLRANDHVQAAAVARFQNPTDHPYRSFAGAAAVFDDRLYRPDDIEGTSDASGHPNGANLQLLVVTGKDLMSLVNHLYGLAANEA